MNRKQIILYALAAIFKAIPKPFCTFFMLLPVKSDLKVKTNVDSIGKCRLQLQRGTPNNRKKSYFFIVSNDIYIKYPEKRDI